MSRIIVSKYARLLHTPVHVSRRSATIETRLIFLAKVPVRWPAPIFPSIRLRWQGQVPVLISFSVRSLSAFVKLTTSPKIPFMSPTVYNEIRQTGPDLIVPSVSQLGRVPDEQTLQCHICFPQTGATAARRIHDRTTLSCLRTTVPLVNYIFLDLPTPVASVFGL